MKKLFLILSALIIGISTYTHLYRIDKTFEFQGDEGRDAIVAYHMIKTGQPVLLGPEMSRGGVFLGPFYYYLTAAGLLMSDLDPVGPAILFGYIGILTTALIIYYAHIQGHQFAGLIAALLYATSPVMLYFSRSAWNPNSLPLFIVFLLLLYPTTKKWHLFFFGLVSGIIFQLHYLAFIFPILLIIRDFYSAYTGGTTRSFLNNFVIILLGFFVTSFPFWLHEFTHNFQNVNAAIDFIYTQRPGSYKYPNYFTRLFANLKTVVYEIIGGHTLLADKISQITIFSAIATLTLYFVNIRGVLTYLTVLSLLIITMFKVEVHSHYLTSLFPLISLIIGFSAIQKGYKKIPALVLLLSLTIPYFKSLNLFIATFTTTPSLPYSETSAYILKEANGRPYNIVSEADFSLSSVLYYLTVSANPPSNTDQSLLFVVCEQSPCQKSYLMSAELFQNSFKEKTITQYLGYPDHATPNEDREIISTKRSSGKMYVSTLMRKLGDMSQ